MIKDNDLQQLLIPRDSEIYYYHYHYDHDDYHDFYDHDK